MNKKVTKEFIQKNLQLFSASSLLRINHYLKENERFKIEVIPAKTGLPIFRHQGVLAHSKYDPLKEGEKKWQSRNYRMQKSVFYLSGDFLYELEAWLTKWQKDNYSQLAYLKTVTLYLFFPLFPLFLSLIKNRDLDFLKQFKSIQVYFPNNVNFFLLDLAKINSKNFFIINDNKNYPENQFLTIILNALNQKRKQIISQKSTELNFQIRWLKNAIKNIYHTTNSYPFGYLVNSFPGEEAVIVGAGLSLYYHFNTIIAKKKSGYKIIIADTCLPAFLRNGVIPDFIVSLDGGYYNALDFKEMNEHRRELTNTMLISNFILYPNVLNNFPGTKCFFHFFDKNTLTENFISEIFSFSASFNNNVLASTSAIISGSSVATIMSEIVVKMGFKKVSIIGLDFKGFFFQNHLPASMHWDFYYKKANRLTPLTHQEFLEVTTSLDQEEKMALPQSQNYQTSGPNLKKYHKEFTATLTKHPEVIWENLSFSTIPKNAVHFFPLTKSVHKKTTPKEIFNDQTRDLFIKNHRNLFSSLKAKIIPFLQNPHKENFKIIEEFFKKNIFLEKIFSFSKEFSKNLLKTNEEVRKKEAYLLLKKATIIERYLEIVAKRVK